MTDERRSLVEGAGPDREAELGFTLRDRRVTDAEIEQLRELSRSGAAEAAPGRAYAVNKIAERYESTAVVVEGPPGRYSLNPDIRAFAEAVIDRELSRRQDDRVRRALLAALAGLPARHLQVIRELCALPRPLESAVQGLKVDDPDGFVTAVNAAVRSHGISEPVVETSNQAVRATTPPDHLVGAVLHLMKREAEQRKLDQLASFLATLDPDQIALLRHLAGLDIADAGALRRLDLQGDRINEQAVRSGFAGSTGLSVLLRRDDWEQWSLPATIRFQLRDLWKPPDHHQSQSQALTPPWWTAACKRPAGSETRRR